jgi:heme exporter protein B
LLLPLLILPLFTPFLIFGVGAMSEAPGVFAQSFLLLSGLTLFSMATMPFAAAFALRLSLE